MFDLSGDEEEFAGGFSGLEVAVRVSGIGERVDVFDAEFESTVDDSVEDVFSAGLEVGWSCDVVLHRGTSDIK